MTITAPRILVRRSGPLSGSVQVPGAKNSVLKLMAATLLAEGEYVLTNVPAITDVHTMADTLASLGVQSQWLGPHELHLVNDGIATTGEIDDAIRYGAGIRWSFMGSFLIYTLAGGDAGMRHFMSQFGPALQLPWTHLVAPELTEGLIDAVVDGTSQQLGTHSIADLERYRDDCLMEVQAAVRTTKLKHGIELDD